MGLKLRYLEDLAPAQRRTVLDLTRRAVDAVSAWVGAHPVIYPARLESFCLVAAVALPFLTVREVVKWAKFVLWCAAVDELTDWKLVSEDDLVRAGCWLRGLDYSRPLASEPDVKVSLHPAQAWNNAPGCTCGASFAGRGFDTVRPLA